VAVAKLLGDGLPGPSCVAGYTPKALAATSVIGPSHLDAELGTRAMRSLALKGQVETILGSPSDDERSIAQVGGDLFRERNNLRQCETRL
jgi:hypothetical protein